MLHYKLVSYYVNAICTVSSQIPIHYVTSIKFMSYQGIYITSMSCHVKLHKGNLRYIILCKEPYMPCQLEIPQFTKFSPVTEQELGKLIVAMPAKSCQLVIIPSDKLKQVLNQCIPAIMCITNLSVETSEFCAERKEELVNP